MLAQERRNQIMQRLAGHGQVLVQELVLDLDVSEDTIRRDLKELAAAGLLKKVHGGAIAGSTVPFAHQERVNLNLESKSKIGQAAAQLVENKMLVYVDGGTTTMQVVPYLQKRPLKCTFVTHSTVMAQSLSVLEGAEIILLGGKLIKELFITAGPESLVQAKSFRPDLALISAHGFTIKAGATVESYEDACIKRQFVDNAGETAVLAGHEKLSFVATYQIAPTEKISYLVTDVDLDAVDELIGLSSKEKKEGAIKKGMRIISTAQSI